MPSNPKGPDIDALIGRMTLTEKVGQMTQVTLQAVTRPPTTPGQRPEIDPDAVRHLIVDRGVGSVLNVRDGALSRESWRSVIFALQDAALSTRLAIPLLYGIDAVHGAGYTREATIFPQGLSMAATWNPDLVRQATAATAAEIRACGIPWNFAPVLDVGRHPLWSRFVETFGEDVLLVSRMGEAAVRGHRDIDGVAACAKHFVGYSAPATGQDRTTAWLPDDLLREIFLPPFRAAVEAGVSTVMVNSGDVNGIPVHASHHLLTDVLRRELGFEGVVVTDWEDVVKLHTVHRVAPTLREAVRLAVEAGIDMSMTPYDADFADELARLVIDGELSEDRIDDSVRRILRLKRQLGLFGHAVPDALPEREVGSDRHRALARQAAKECLVVLQNANELPLATDSRILLAGRAALSSTMLLGSWTGTWQGTDELRVPTATPSIAEAFRYGIGERLIGPIVDSGEMDRLVGPADRIVVVLGEQPSVEMPGNRHDLILDPRERRMAEAALRTGKPVTLVLLFDRPLLVADLVDRSAAVVWAGRPGAAGAGALLDLLTGQAEPEGRLPFTWPRHAFPLLTYDHRHSDRLGSSYGLQRGFPFDAFDPQWRFGHGLSYADLVVESAELAAHAVGAEDEVRVHVTVTNRGSRWGVQVLQVYVSDRYASVAPPVERLRAFRKVSLAPGETRAETLVFPVKDLAFHGHGELRLEAGEYEVRVHGVTMPLTLLPG